MSLFLSSLAYIYIISSFFSMKLLDVRWRRRLHIVRVVFDVVVLQDWLQASPLLLPTLLWARDLCRQSVFGEQRLLPGRQLARFDDLFDAVLNRSPFLPW